MAEITSADLLKEGGYNGPIETPTESSFPKITTKFGYVKTYKNLNKDQVSHLIIHHTGGSNPESALNWWKNPESGGVGAHYVVNADGSIIQTAPLNKSTGHILPDLATKKINNASAIGIEVVAPSDKDVTPAQQDAVLNLYKNTISPVYPNIKPENILGHGQEAKGYTGKHARDISEGATVVNYVRKNLQNPEMAFNTNLVKSEDLLNYAESPEMQEKNQSKVNAGYGQILKNTTSNLVNPRFVAQDLAAKADLAYGVVPGAINFVGTPFAKLANVGGQAINAITGQPTVNPQVGTQALSNLTETMQNPVGKAFGITQEPAYKNEIANRIANTIGNVVGLPIDYIAKKTGLPKEDIAWYANAAGIKLAPALKKGYTGISEELQRTFENKKPTVTIEGANYHPELDTESNIPRFIEKEVTVPKDISHLTPEELDQWFENPQKITGTVTKTRLMPNPEHPEFKTPTRNIDVIEENPALPTQPLDVGTKSQRQKLLEDIGIERIRNSALEGDYKNASSQYITSKADNGPYAQGMGEQIQHEKDVLTNHFGGVESELGGTVPRRGTSFEVSDEMQRGKTVKTALEEAQEAHQKKTTELYNKAHQETGAIPVELNNLKNYLDKNSNFVHAPEKTLRKGINDYLNEQGLLDETGEIKPMTVGQSEQLRKFINKQYNYETKNKIGDLVNTIDDDVFKNVQGPTYEEARKHFKAGKEIYDNPKAIKNLLSDEGVNQKIPDEKVINKIATLDESQFGHLINTLKETEKTQALSEIQTALVNRIKEAGQSEIGEPFNARAAAKERAKLSQKLNIAFAENPELLDKIDKGIEAGNILHIPTKYPGAAVQTNLLKNKFGEIALQRAGTTIGAGMGGFVGGPIGGAIGAAGGEFLGGKGATRLKSGRQTKQLQKEITPTGTKLSDIGK